MKINLRSFDEILYYSLHRMVYAYSAWIEKHFLLIHAMKIYSETSAMVQSTEFNLLIVIANEISLVILWLVVFSVWCLIKTKTVNCE